MSVSEFADLGLAQSLTRAIRELGYIQPTPIQALAIPRLMNGGDLLATAQTGTGKTAGFGLPMLQRFIAEGKSKAKEPRGLVLAPTRELALQILDDLNALARFTNLKIVAIYGGVGKAQQIRALRAGVGIIVATPGRLLDLMGEGHARLDRISTLALDEADRLLDMGFIHDVRRIVQATPTDRQSMLFSATMPKAVTSLAGEILDAPARVDVSPEELTVANIHQQVMRVAREAKQSTLEQLLREPAVRRAIVFTRTKHRANRVARALDRAGIAAEAIHGNKSQNARQRALQGFKDNRIWVLVATDIAARGIDIDDVSHVVNFDVPNEVESYVHRIGRTARAGASGVAWTLVDSTEEADMAAICRFIDRGVEEIDDRLSTVGTFGPAKGRTPKTPRPSANAHQQSGDAKQAATRRPRRRKPRRRKKPSATQLAPV